MQLNASHALYARKGCYFDPTKFFCRLQKKMGAFGPKAGATSSNIQNKKIVGSSSTFRELDTPIQPTVTSSNPSSEAEALSNVASGIAASLGLAAEPAAVTSQEFSEMNNPATSTAIGPLSDLEHYEVEESDTLLISYGRVDESPKNEENISAEHADNEDISPEHADNEDISAEHADNEDISAEHADLSTVESEKSKELSTVTKSEVDCKGKEVVSQLAMDWNDEEEESNA